MGGNEHFVEIPLDPAFSDQTDEMSFVLKPSSAGGIGVFATHGIRQGTLLGLFPVGETRLISHAEQAANPRLRRFCQFYGVEFEGATSVAPNFGAMSVGWHLNHSENPNAAHNETWEYHATRDIAAGEEVTIDYRAL